MVTTWQAILFGVAFAYTPAALLLAFVLWRDGVFDQSPPRPAQPEILTADRAPYCRLASEIRNCAAHINDTLASQNELAARIQFINSCKLVLVMVGFDISPHPGAGRIIEDDDGEAMLPHGSPAFRIDVEPVVSAWSHGIDRDPEANLLASNGRAQYKVKARA